MHNRITNISDNNKPIIRVLDEHQAEQISQLYEDSSDKITRKRSIKRAISIIFLSVITIWALYHLFFVLEFKEVPSVNLTASEIKISSDDILSFHMQSSGYYISDDYMIDVAGELNDIYYIRIKQPLIPIKRFEDEQNSERFTSNYEIDITGVSSVYYMGTDAEDTFVIWKRH
jgi:hypothetical protein